MLGISFARRMLAAGICLAMTLFTITVFPPPVSGWLVLFTAMIVALIAIFLLCEKVVLIDRRAFTCKTCGYNLHGLTENRCPECGTEFDPQERDQILARIASPPPKPKYRWIAPLVVVLLSLAVAANMVVWRRAPVAATTSASAPATQPSSPNRRGNQ